MAEQLSVSRPVEPLAVDLDRVTLRDALKSEINQTSQFGRGWNSAGLSEDANSLLWKARNAYAAGDQAGGAALEQQGRDIMQQSQQWAPTVQNFTDINGAGSAVDWAGGALGNMRSSVRPAIGGLAGAAVGALAAPFTAGMVNPVTGARAGAFLAGYDQMTEAEAGKAMLDQRIRNARTMDEIGNASRMSGAVQGALESVVPGSLAKNVAGLTAKEARAQIAKNGIAKTIAKKAGEEGAQEFATEFAQNPVGDVTQNYLREDPLDNIDWKGAFNAGMAGMVAGGGMGTVGGAAETAHAKMQSGVESAGKAVDKVKADPLGTVLDAGVDLATKAGEYITKAGYKMDRAQMKKDGLSEDEIDEVLAQEALAAFKNKSPKSLQPDDDTAKGLEGNDYVAHREELAKQDAIEILKAHKGDATPEMKELAQGYIGGTVKLEDFMAGIGKHGAEHKEQKATDDFLSGLGQGSKKSLMRPDQTGTELRTETAAESRAANEGVKTAKINTLADILVKQGASENIVKTASDASSAHQLPRMVGMMSWIADGMKSPVKAVETITKHYGKGAEGLFGKAYDLAVNNGLVPRNDNVAKNIKQLLKLKVDGDTKLRGAIAMNLSDIAKSKVTGDMNDTVEQLVPVISEMVAHGMSKKQEAFLIENVFGTEERLYNVINAYVENGLHKPQVSKATGGGNGATQDGAATNEDDKLNDDVVSDSERDFEESRATQTELGSTEKSKHYWQDRPNIKEGKAGSQYFDTRNAEHKQQLGEMTEKLTAASGEDDSVRRTAALTGKVTHELEKARQEKGVDVLPTNTRDSIIRSIVHEHYPKLERLPRRPADVTDFTMKEYDKRKAAYERKIKFLATQIDKRFKTLRIDQQESTKLGTDFDKADLAGLRLHRDLKDTKNGVNNGTVVLETTDKDGKVQKTPFITSTQMIVAKMLKIRDNSTESSKEYKGTAQFYAQLVNDGISSILQNEGFTGRFGTVRNGKIIWSLPHDMVVYTNKNSGERMTLGLARQQEAKQSANGSREFSSNEKRKALSDKSAEVSTEEAKSIGHALKSGGAQLEAAFEKYFPNGLVDNKADFDPSEVSQVDLEVKELGLSAFDPETEIHRDEKGFAATNDTTMKAGLMVGTTKSMAADKADPARKVKRAGGDQIAARDWVVGLLEKGVPAFNAAMRKFSGNVEVTDRVEAGFNSLMTMSEQGVAEQILGDKTKIKEAATIIARAIEVRGDKYVVRNARGKTEVRGRSDAVRGQRAKEVDAALDQHGEAASTDVVAAEAASDGGQVNGKGSDGETLPVRRGQSPASGERVGQVSGINRQAGEAHPNKDESNSGNTGRFGGPNATTDKQKATSAQGLASETNGQNNSVLNQLQAYLDEHGSKNAAWAGAARRAIASNNETQIKNTLVAAKKQFGEAIVENRSVSHVPKDNLSEHQRALFIQHWNQLAGFYEKGATITTNLSRFHKLSKHLSDTGRGVLPYAAQNTPDAKKFLGSVREYLLSHGFPVNDTLFVLAELSSTDSELINAGSYFKTFNAIAIDKEAFEDALKNDTFGTEFIRTLLHEGAHRLDNGVMTDKVPKLLPLSSFWNTKFKVADGKAVGVFAKEAEDASKSGEYATFFQYPFDPAYNTPATEFRAEIFAQLYTIHKFDPQWSSVNTPEFSKFAKEIDNAKSSAEVELIISGEPTLGHLAVRGRQANRNADQGFFENASRTARSYTNGNAAVSDKARVSAKPIDGTVRVSENSSPVKQSSQKPTEQGTPVDEQVAAAKEHILKTIGTKIKLDFEHMTDGSGSWTPGETMNVIKLALNGDIVGAAFHESFHEFVNILKKNGGAKNVAIMERAAMNPLMQRKLSLLLDGHPEAQAQLSNPEEAAAFMYQFWSQGSLKIGPETRSTFQTIKNMLKKAAGFFSETFRKQVVDMKREELENGAAERLMREFTSGAVADAETRQAVVEAMNKDAAKHDAAVEHIGAAYKLLNDTAGKLIFSSEAMMDATGNKYMVGLSRLFHQKIGTPMLNGAKFVGSYSDGLRQQTSHWINRLEESLVGYSKDEIELAREHLSKGTKPTDPKVKEIVGKINTFYADMAKYIKTKDVRRLNMDRVDEATGTRGVWEEIPFRENYFTQVWSVDAVAEDMEGFKATLLKRHMSELTHIAEQANKELKDMSGIKKGTAAAAELERADKEFAESGKVMAKLNLQTITPEMIADAIAMRLLNAQGHIEIDEDTSGLGITPAASAVNKRQLDWLDKDLFDKYKEKDLTRIMSTYARNIVKRGEYQSRFGYGGEKIADAADKALLSELGGDALIAKAEAGMDTAKKAWNKEAAAARKGGAEYDVPYPTLRSVGQDMHKAEVGQEKHDELLGKSMKKLESGFKAIQAMEGTLGRDITPNQRALNSWLVTYQSFRTLSTMLFTSFQDVMGIVANGGEMGDAWKAFVSGIREIKNTVTDKKSPSAMMERAEFWGAVDGGAFLDSLGQAYGSPFMSGKAKVLSDKFFKYTGAEGWNRGVRAVASQVAERIITDWKKNGIDAKDVSVVARVEDLFGKGFDVKNIKLDSEGRLDINDVANQAAVTRWMLTAVPAPTAAHRPIWGSDPHFQVFMHLKNYTYSFHRIMMKGAVEQAKLGNYRPAAVMAIGYVPIAIAAGAIKEMLIPGDEPPWMKGGLDGYLSYGWSRAGVLGVPQMYAGTLYDADPAALFGPTADQLQNVMSIPFGEFMAMRDHTVVGEGLSALPGGNLLKRLEKLGNL